ncbi:TetR/AcrR family transcriptional regulator [Salinicoccus cyprini]|uniref:TetR/AcrR family transcriptional regulator n=1 Tax=Salinicoccus cyprini TaxID=2493691 RepID=A0A558AXE4_9STAP|nr:TetR/AcrR family transcriptional regulator [Salinicoccus cyprini]TVT28927.1 TetR/AcrR family transcriptional regulator [Salinicoccus cyprini]
MTKDKILASTLKHLSIYGYEGTTMKNIAKDCDIKAASIYYFFKNKDELVNDVLLKVLSNHFKAMTDEYFKHEDASLEVRLEAMLAKIAAHHRENRSETSVYLRLMESTNDDFKMEVEQYLEQYNHWLYDKLYADIKAEYREVDDTSAGDLLETFLLIGNGIFWGSIIYSDARMEKEIAHAKKLMNLALRAMLKEA